MKIRRLLTIFLTTTALSGGVQAADISIVGRWFSTGQGSQVEMDFARDGNCLITITANGKAASLGGGYTVAEGKLVIHPQMGDPIVYGLNLQGDSMSLSGGNFAPGRVLTLSRHPR
jgi:hypothetical protein